MRTQHLFILAIIVTAFAGSHADAAEFAMHNNLPILSDVELGDSASLTIQDFTGGVGLSGGDASPVVIQMAQPSSSSSPSNAPSSYAYVRSSATASH